MSLIAVNNVDLDYIDVGEGDVIVLLHGLGSTKKDYDLQIPVLSNKFRVIAVDFRAHGGSTRVPTEFGVHVMCEDIYQLIQKLNIPKATFVGFSMGGAVCFQMALSHPESVDKLVIINSGPDFNNTNDTGIDILAERTKLIKEQGFLALTQTISKNMFPNEDQQAWRDEFAQRVAANDEDAYLNTFGHLMKFGIGEQLSSIPHETLVIASDMDYTPVEYKKSYTAKMQNAIIKVIENSRHGVVLDQADILNDELLKFL